MLDFGYTSPKFGTGFRAVSPVRASRPDRTARFERPHQRFPLASASQQATRAISSVQHGRSGTLQPALRLLLPLLCVELGVAHCAPHSLYRVLRWRCTRGCGEGDSCTLSCPPPNVRAGATTSRANRPSEGCSSRQPWLYYATCSLTRQAAGCQADDELGLPAPPRYILQSTSHTPRTARLFFAHASLTGCTLYRDNLVPTRRLKRLERCHLEAALTDWIGAYELQREEGGCDTQPSHTGRV